MLWRTITLTSSCWLLLTALVGGQTTREDLKAQPTDLVVLNVPKAQAGQEGRSVVWSFISPIDRKFEAFTTPEADKCVFVSAAPGGRVAVEATVVDWEQRRLSKRLWIVTSEGAPGPGPGPGPTPVPEGFYGLTRFTASAVAANQPAPASLTASLTAIDAGIRAAEATAKEAAEAALRKQFTEPSSDPPVAAKPTVAQYFKAVDTQMEPLTAADAKLAAVMLAVENECSRLWDSDQTKFRKSEDAVPALQAIADGLRTGIPAPARR